MTAPSRQEKKITKKPEESNKKSYVLPVREAVLFPNTVFVLKVSSARSIRLIEEAEQKRTTITVITQKDNDKEITPKNLYETGTLGKIVKVLPHSSKQITAVIKGTDRVKIHDIQLKSVYSAQVSVWK